MDNPFDRMILFCAWCGHLWRFTSDKIGTDKQIDDWFRTYEKEHKKVCKIYKILNEYKREL